VDTGLVLFESLALGVVVGAILSVFGAGGSLLATPTLVFLFGLQVPIATLTTLIVVGSSSLIGAVSRIRHGEAKVKLGLQISVFGLPGTLLGATLARYIPDWVTLCLLVMMMFYAGISIYRGPAVRSLIEVSHSKFLIAFIASAIGFLTGLLGIGGGILLVPALVLFLATPTAIAIGTSLISISTTAIFALLLRSSEFSSLPLIEVVVITLASIGAVLAVAPLARRMRGRALDKFFAIFLFVIGVLTYLATVFAW
jgi:uncharacterized membrane protein YfcA